MVNEKLLEIYSYIIGFVTLAVLILISAVYGTNLTNIILLLILLCMELVIDNFRIVIKNVEISLCTIIEIACFLALGTASACWMAFLSITITDYFIKKRPFKKVILSIGIGVMDILAGAVSYTLAQSIIGTASGSFFYLQRFIPVAAFGITYILAGSVILYIKFIIFDKSSIKDSLLKSLIWEVTTMAVSIPVSMGFAEIYYFTSERSTLFSIIFLLPVTFICIISVMIEKMVFTNRQLRELSNVALTINSNLELEVIYNSVFDTINSMTKADGCYIFDTNYENNCFIPISYRTTEAIGDGMRSVDMKDSIFSKVVHSMSPVIMNNLKKYRNTYSSGTEYYNLYSSCMLIPMRRLNRCTGCIAIFNNTSYVFYDNIQRFLMILSEQATIAMENAKLFRTSEEEAITDNLTCLYNQRYFYSYLNTKINEFRDNGGRMSLIMFDIDHFKNVNDTYGHLSGDYVLKEIAWLMKSCVRKNDVVSRYGGEEFTIILPDLDSYEACTIAERIREKIQNRLFLIDAKEIKVTISGGVSEYPKSADNATDLVTYADRAMYVGAKFRGRNKVEIYGTNLL